MTLQQTLRINCTKERTTGSTNLKLSTPKDSTGPVVDLPKALATIEAIASTFDTVSVLNCKIA